jgi:hypothetical protein
MTPFDPERTFEESGLRQRVAQFQKLIFNPAEPV